MQKILFMFLRFINLVLRSDSLVILKDEIIFGRDSLLRLIFLLDGSYEIPYKS